MNQATKNQNGETLLFVDAHQLAHFYYGRVWDRYSNINNNKTFVQNYQMPRQAICFRVLASLITARTQKHTVRIKKVFIFKSVN